MTLIPCIVVRIFFPIKTMSMMMIRRILKTKKAITNEIVYRKVSLTLTRRYTIIKTIS